MFRDTPDPGYFLKQIRITLKRNCQLNIDEKAPKKKKKAETRGKKTGKVELSATRSRKRKVTSSSHAAGVPPERMRRGIKGRWFKKRGGAKRKTRKNDASR